METDIDTPDGGFELVGFREMKPEAVKDAQIETVKTGNVIGRRLA